MKENTIYRLSEITVNADELRRIKAELDELAAAYIVLYRRLENLINQGTITKHATKKEDTQSPSRLTSTEKNTKPEEPRIFTGDIRVNKTLVSSVTLKAASKAAAQMAIFKMINVKVK